jgi:hypothetical protein
MQVQEKVSIIKKMDKENQLDKDLQAAAEKKDKAMATDPTLKDQFKIGIEFRKDQGLAVIKDKTKNIVKKGKNKFYGVVDLLKNKID